MEPSTVHPLMEALNYVLLAFGWIVAGNLLLVFLILVRGFRGLVRPQRRSNSINGSPQDTFNDILHGFGLEDFHVEEGLADAELYANSIQ